jgi:FkbM family methyltransferase
VVFFKDERQMYDFVLRIGFLLNSLNLDFTVLTEKFEQRSFAFRILNFLSRHKGEVSYAEKGKFKLSELNLDFEFDFKDVGILNSYFGAKKDDKIHFFSSNRRIFAQVHGLVFLIPFPHGVWELTETFINEAYGYFNLKNKTVVDIGAFIGDTAAYFASKGAIKVLAFEASPPIFEIAQENIKINKLQKTVEIRNYAVSGIEGEIGLSFYNCQPGSSSIVFQDYHSLRSTNYQVKATTLNQIMKEVNYIDLLKIDCEGAEYQILSLASTEGNLKNVSNIIMEIHGPPRQILDILKSNQFKTVKWLNKASGCYFLAATRNDAKKTFDTLMSGKTAIW